MDDALCLGVFSPVTSAQIRDWTWVLSAALHVRQLTQYWCRMQVLYGLDFTAQDEQQQHLLLQQAILDHAKAHPESLLVVEEYDKMSCKTRGFLRQVIENSASANVSLAR